MIERWERFNARLKKSVNELLIPGETLLVHRTSSVRKNSWPSDGEAVRRSTELLQDGDVFAPAVIRIGARLAVFAVVRLPRNLGEAIPDRLAASVFFGGPFNLIRRGAEAPREALWESLGECRLVNHLLPPT